MSRRCSTKTAALQNFSETSNDLLENCLLVTVAVHEMKLRCHDDYVLGYVVHPSKVITVRLSAGV